MMSPADLAKLRSLQSYFKAITCAEDIGASGGTKIPESLIRNGMKSFPLSPDFLTS